MNQLSFALVLTTTVLNVLLNKMSWISLLLLSPSWCTFNIRPFFFIRRSLLFYFLTYFSLSSCMDFTLYHCIVFGAVTVLSSAELSKYFRISYQQAIILCFNFVVISIKKPLQATSHEILHFPLSSSFNPYFLCSF